MYENENRERMVILKKFNEEVRTSMSLKNENYTLKRLIENLESRMQDIQTSTKMNPATSPISNNRPSLRTLKSMKSEIFTKHFENENLGIKNTTP